jgi:pentose-5-phosphate-3-epimerase
VRERIAFTLTSWTATSCRTFRWERRSWHRLRPVTRLPLETHLMISNPDLFLQEFTQSGSDSFLVHWEGNVHLHRTVQAIRTLGKRAGVAINPATPAAVLEEILLDVDQVLVMTVDPVSGISIFSIPLWPRSAASAR